MDATSRICGRVTPRPVTPSVPGSGPKGGAPRWSPGTRAAISAGSPSLATAAETRFPSSGRPAGA